MRYIFTLIFLLLFLNCDNTNAPKKYVIGFSQCIGTDPWRKKMQKDMENELYFFPNLELITKDALGSTQRQISHIEELIKKDIDLLIVSPFEASPLNAVIKKVYELGIPVIILDREITADTYTTYIGADNYKIGHSVGEYIKTHFDSANILECKGISDTSPTTDRHNGFNDAIKNAETINVVHNLEVFFDENGTLKLPVAADLPVDNIDVVYAHTDVIAFLSYTYLKQLQPNNTIKFYGIDGLYGENNGIDLVEKNILQGTFIYPTGGQEAIRVANDILNKNPVKKNYELLTNIIDSSNVEIMKFQEEKLLNQQNNIDLQQQIIAIQKDANKKQKTGLVFLSLALLVIIVLFGVLVYAYRKIKTQKEQIEDISRERQEIANAKFKFFTNISHEFKTPITLILSPIEDILHNLGYGNKKNIKDLKIVKRNALRLQRLVNQIMDFSKIDNKKYKLVVNENDIILFTKELMIPFQRLASDNFIDFKLHSDLEELKLWFDPNLIDKVIFNLMSNAFKFTENSGHITINISEDDQYGIIKVHDDGKGILPEDLPNIFNRFYGIKHSKGSGTGLGLSLSKEFVELHKGHITVVSKPNKETVFTVKLRKGNAHFSADDINTSKMVRFFRRENEYLFETASSVDQQPYNDDDDTNKKEYGILLIEDNRELNNYLSHQLAKDYDIISAFDGLTGLRLAFEKIPDLVITDIQMPNLDGLDVLQKLKTDIRTSHIPIIVLSSKTHEDEVIKGLKTGADLYLTKPFKINYLSENIRSLLNNRQLMKQYYSNLEGITTGDTNIDASFIFKFKELITTNYKNPNYNVEEIYTALGMSRVQLYRKVKALMGCGVNDFLNNYRLNEAKKLLSDSELSISEVAFESGFTSSSYFSTAFKAKFDNSPSNFRKKL